MKKKLIVMQMFSFIVSILPIIITVIVNKNVYVKSVSDAVKLSIAGIICMIFIFLKVVGKLKIPKRIVTYGIVFIMAYLLDSLMGDILLLSGMAFIGELADAMLFAIPIKRLKEKILIEKTADATSDKVEELLKKYIGEKE